MLSIILYYDPHVTYADLALCVTLLGSHSEIVHAMRHKEWIFVGIAVPIILNHIIIDVWLVKGSGNANFMFFQGLVMWIFLALGMIEYVNALLSVSSREKAAEA